MSKLECKDEKKYGGSDPSVTNVTFFKMKASLTNMSEPCAISVIVLFNDLAPRPWEQKGRGEEKAILVTSDVPGPWL